MKLLPLLLLSLSVPAVLPGCATLQQKRCDALKEEMEDANDPCDHCKDTLLQEDHALCQYVCSHPKVVADAVFATCMPEAPPAMSTPAAAPEETSSDVSADSSTP